MPLFNQLASLAQPTVDAAPRATNNGRSASPLRTQASAGVTRAHRCKF